MRRCLEERLWQGKMVMFEYIYDYATEIVKRVCKAALSSYTALIRKQEKFGRLISLLWQFEYREGKEKRAKNHPILWNVQMIKSGGKSLAQ